ncbi:response regulator [Psychromonas sp. KJ10-10]|uniref:response regulator n=1 Tax=Psychromonas sp. KJ10-10 TaxID=3391823 RepID=UPI0039B66500
MKYETSVLYIESNKEAQKFHSKLLRRLFNTVIEANDGKEGLSKFITHAPGLVITDIQMPNMNGLELIREIRKVDDITPIIVFSADIKEDFLLDTIKELINGTINKPTTDQNLSRIIAQALSIDKNNIDKAKSEELLPKQIVNESDELRQTNDDLMVVGIGSSAGGLKL